MAALCWGNISPFHRQEAEACGCMVMVAFRLGRHCGMELGKETSGCFEFSAVIFNSCFKHPFCSCGRKVGPGCCERLDVTKRAWLWSSRLRRKWLGGQECNLHLPD